MMRRTRTTSTSGVTLIAVIGASSSISKERRAISALVLLARLFGEREEIARHRVGEAQAITDHPAEIVVRGDGGDGDEEADRCNDKRLTDLGHQAARHLALALIELVECADDADDRPEQPDEGGVIADRPEEGEVPLHQTLRHRGLTLEALFEAIRAHLEDVDHLADDLGGLGARALGELLRPFKIVLGEALLEGFSKLRKIVPRREKIIHTIEDDREADDGEADEEPHHPGRAEHREGC